MNKDDLNMWDVNWKAKAVEGLRRCLKKDVKLCEGCPYVEPCVKEGIVVLPESMGRDLMKLLEKEIC